MSKVLTTESNVTCGHQGQVQISSSAKLKVNSKPVLLESSITGMLIQNCATPTTQAQGKYVSFSCASVSATGRTSPIPPTETTSSPISDGRSKKLMVGKMPVMLETVAGQSSGLAGETDGMVSGVSPVTGLQGTAVQNKLAAV
ncbi:hypothetical protein [Dictyobacter formicarum]|uniref:Tox-PAAR-like domain-containing protein n=1 Tax=Dictyobacter formicarum TaxID=2778368 RepID=A0ABQ3VB64_9CHLR|nr:hypothetical protein [Dictyobacter formicarum]GHO83200.1 hypothetical protein KSZ_12060 [Dictyobacter formicarum]